MLLDDNHRPGITRFKDEPYSMSYCVRPTSAYKEYLDFRRSRELYKMLHALYNLLEIAYKRDCDRSDANIMDFYPKTLEFAV